MSSEDDITLDALVPESLRGVLPLARFTAHGEPASKANSRRLVRIGTAVRSIKSAKALAYAQAFAAQCPALPAPYAGPVAVVAAIWYASERPDLDASLILDGMQGRVYVNDRQVRAMHIARGTNREQPRCDIAVYPLACSPRARPARSRTRAPKRAP